MGVVALFFVALDLEENAEAQEYLSEALLITLEVQATLFALEALTGLARLLARRGEIEQGDMEINSLPAPLPLDCQIQRV